MKKLYQIDQHFKKEGATHYYDEVFIDKTFYRESRHHFSRHYFKHNKENEIGYVLLDLLSVEGYEPHMFEIPRKWGYNIHLESIGD